MLNTFFWIDYLHYSSSFIQGEIERFQKSLLCKYIKLE